MDWHTLDIATALARLKSSAEGLSSAEAAARLRMHGPNRIREAPGRSPLLLFLDQFRDFMIIVLMLAAGVSAAMGERVDAAVIVAILFMNAVIGFVQEYRAGKAMEALQKMAAPDAVSIRDGGPAKVPATALVPGDVVILETGNIVPADLRLMEAANLKIQEAALTGESTPVEKSAATIAGSHVPVADRRNMAFKGTIVTGGRGRGLIAATGMETELGKIAGMLEETGETKTPLQRRLTQFGKRLSIFILIICAVIFAAGLARGEDPFTMFLTAVSLAVAAIPEALPAVITVSLSLGARKMVRNRALVKKLPAVETLGSVTYICTDKTGTLTLNSMTVEQVWLEGAVHPADSLESGIAAWDAGTILCRGMLLCNDARIDAEGKAAGDPTEGALLVAAGRWGCDGEKLRRAWERIDEIAFDSDRKKMTTFHRSPEGVTSFTKGAQEVITDGCRNMLGPDGPVDLDIAEIRSAAAAMAREGLRVIAFAMRQWEGLPVPLPEDAEREMLFIGLVGMLDPPREEAASAVRTCIGAGIVPVMITGDHPLTAMNIARRTGIVAEEAGSALSGTELAAIPQEELERQVERIRVYARVAPEQKLKIVTALQDRGEYVAMTGDGVNDAPALQKAEIGVAMGITGTDVAKEASDLILLDDNFATIVGAVKEGRRIFDNIRKFVKYVMTGNSAEIWTILLPPFFGLPMPLLPIHILWINLVTDGLPGLALAAEPAEKRIMDRPPRPPGESIFAHGLGNHILWVGALMGAVTILTQAWSVARNDDSWQTMVFTVLCFSQIGHVMAIRSERESLFTMGLLSNIPLLGAFLLTLVLQLAIIYLPVLNLIFRTRPLSAADLLAVVLLSSAVFFAVEIEKFCRRKSRKKSSAHQEIRR